jgi:phosphoribosylamine--glycine ligase
LLEAGIPTARSFVVSTVDEVALHAREFAPPYVLKADGLAAGKGVFVCKTLKELLAAAHSIFVEGVLGEAGRRALLEEFQPGYEISSIVLTNGERFEALPFAQDHKRLLDGDEGPNTGGMGVVAPVGLPEDLRSRIDREVLEPTMRLMRKRNLVYRGALFVGLMITPNGPSVLEFNTRFGDPETQAILPLLDGDWGLVFSELAAGRLMKLRWKPLASCCVVLAAEGYPDTPVKGAVIEGLEGGSVNENRYVLHAGTRRDAGGAWVTSGGRVIGAMGTGGDLREAVDNAYAVARGIRWPGLQKRSDIGAGVLGR